MKFNIILLAFSIYQFGVCHRISNGISKCKYKDDHILGEYVAIDCRGMTLFLGICDNLIDIINISSIVTVSFKNCEIDELSEMSKLFPNISKLAFLYNNTLPSTNFSFVEHLSLFVNTNTKSKVTRSSFSTNGSNLALFQFEGNPDNDIESISLGNPKKLEFFSLQKTTISTLPASIFKSSSNLTAVHATFNAVEHIDSIEWPNSVKWINFTSNKITKLTKRSFKNLTNLQILKLSKNEIGEIEAETFFELNNLYILSLDRNHIEKITKKTFSGLDKLIGIDLSDNKISSLNQNTFAGLNGVLNLKLTLNPIRQIDIDAFVDLAHLLLLDMSSTELETIDFNLFTKTMHLTKLDLSNNHIWRLIKMVPDATNNTLVGLFPEQLSKFKPFDEWLNPILAKGKQLFSRKTKTTIDELLSISKQFEKLALLHKYSIAEANNHNYRLDRKLKNLNLSGNKLIVIENNIFTEFKLLEWLNLSRNPITILYPESFAGLRKLKDLQMDHCALTSIDFSIFNQLDKLQKLDLSHNQLITITAAPLSSLKSLFINNNQLSEFTMKMTDLPDLLELYVQHNNFNCKAIADTFEYINLDCDALDSAEDELDCLEEDMDEEE